MRSIKTALTVMGAITVLILAANTVAYAATGGTFILGRFNKTNRVSTLRRTSNGPALNLVTRPSSTAPFTVNSSGKVTNLNADRLDGLDATALQTRPIVYRIPSEVGVTAFQVTFPGLAPGLYQISYSLVSKMSVTSASIGCDVEPTAGSFYELLSYGVTLSNSYATTNASGVIDTRTTARRLRCFTLGGAATVDPDFSHQSQIVLTPVDALSDTVAAAARVGSSMTPGAAN